jgi:hypothetical protein
MGWLVNATLRPLYPQEREPVPIVHGAGWAPGPVWKISLVPVFDLLTVQPVQSRYTDWAMTAQHLHLVPSLMMSETYFILPTYE